MTGKLWQHYNITTDVMARFQQQGVLDVSELEQTMATGVDGDGRAAKEEKMVQGLEAMLQGPEAGGMTLANKMRLVAIFIISQDGITEEARRQLVAAAGLSLEDQEALIHLEALGVSVAKAAKGSGSSGMGLWGSKAKKPKRKVETASEYAASRYVCALKEVMDQAVKGELSAEAYPSVLPMPTRCVVDGGSPLLLLFRGDIDRMCQLVGRCLHHTIPCVCAHHPVCVCREDKPVARSLRKPDKGRLGKQPASYTGGACMNHLQVLMHSLLLVPTDRAATSRPFHFLHPARTIVFLAGGVAFSEMRAAYEVMEQHKKEVIIGGTSYLKPNDYVEQLRAIKG